MDFSMLKKLEINSVCAAYFCLNYLRYDFEK